jgi:N-acetylneuraminic acid mutarotase
MTPVKKLAALCLALSGSAVLLLADHTRAATANLWQRVSPAAPWGVRAMPRGGLLDDHFYVIAGRAGAFTLYGDTWRSTDGLHWEVMSDDTGWGKRAYTEVEIVRGNLVLTGGQGLATFYNDVWRSADQGKSWRQVNASAPWAPRAGHYTMVVDDDIYLFAGGRNSWNRVFYPELWVSHDLGTTWELRARLPDDMGRAGMQVIKVGGSLYFMGGDHDKPVFFANWPGRRNDVWQSDDLGRTWTLLGNAGWSPRTGHQCAGFDGRIICIGGHGRGPEDEQILLHDMWTWDPKDGINGWKRVSNTVWGCPDNPESCGKSDFLLAIRDGKAWTFGGDEEVAAPYPQDNDVWVADLATSN